MKNSAIAIIPARYGSTRLPGKPLMDINGKPMIIRVWEIVSRVLPTYVATDDQRIFDVVHKAGGDAIMTSSASENGTARVHEALLKLKIRPEIILNIQGDEPLVSDHDINVLLLLMKRESVKIGTLVTSISQEDLISGNNCFVDRSPDGMCQEFSRTTANFSFKKYRHIGMYGFNASILSKLVLLKRTDGEKRERLEQLRWKENGYEIHSSIVPEGGVGVDTLEDLKSIRKGFRRDL